MSAEATKLTFGDAGGDLTESELSGLILQQIQITYSQNVSRLYALEDGKVYFIAGRTDGQFVFQHVVGPAGLKKEFLNRFGDVCGMNGKSFVLSASAGCTAEDAESSQGTGKVILNNPLITSVQMSMNNQDFIISNVLQGMFTSLQFETSGGGGGGGAAAATAAGIAAGLA